MRTILEADIERQDLIFPGGLPAGGDHHLVRLRLVGTGFLKQMVRGIAGTVLQVGDGRRGPGCISEILESLERQRVGPTAPGRALWLERVWYPENLGLG